MESVVDDDDDCGFKDSVIPDVPLIKNQRSDFHVSFGISQKKKVLPRPRLTRLEKLHTHLRFLAL